LADVSKLSSRCQEKPITVVFENVAFDQSIEQEVPLTCVCTYQIVKMMRISIFETLAEGFISPSGFWYNINT